MAPVALKLTLLLGILLQYAPLRICELQLAAFGADCHDRSGTGTSPASKMECGAQDDPAHACVCEQPQLDGRDQQPAVKSPVHWLHLPAAPTRVPAAAPAATTAAIPGPEPHAGPPAALQLPLLI